MISISCASRSTLSWLMMSSFLLSSTVITAAADATLATNRMLPLTWAGYTGWIAPACGWRTHSITSSVMACHQAV